MATAMGVMAALYERTRTGKGRIVETSLFATGMYTAGWDLSVQLTMGRLSSMRSRTKSQTPMVNSYRSADDKWFFLIGLEAGRHFPGLAKAIGRPELAEDDRFGSAKSIFANAEALVTVLDEIFSEHPMSHWAPLFEANDVWWAPCQTMADVATDPQALALGLFIDTDDSAWDTAERVPPKVRTVASPATFDGQVFLPRRPVPSLGEHTAEVIAELDAT
jgi:crotonobetainyl-CoA:carnitine CoA-transferase CaiB-like acyl-CoA transferase